MATATDVRAEIEAAQEGFMTAFNQGDAAALAALYTTGGQLLPPQSDFVTGRDAIKTFWQGVMDMGIKEAKLETVEAEATRRCSNRNWKVHDVRRGRPGRRLGEVHRDLEERTGHMETASGHLE